MTHGVGHVHPGPRGRPRSVHAGKFGDEFLLPESFNLRLDTSEFPVD
ncbi:hypothetical protein [Streptomyces sp. NPDC027717]